MAQIRRIVFVLFSCGIVPACGGGGGSSGGGGTPTGPIPALVFLADANIVGQKELFVADAAGTFLTNLSGPLVSGGNVQVSIDYWSPDRTKIAFIADKITKGVPELFVVPSSGGTPVKVSGPLIAGGKVTEFKWSPNSSQLVYVADADTLGTFELYVVNSDGTGRVKISGPMAAGSPGDPNQPPAWAPDGSRIAYLAFQNSTTVQELFTSKPDGSANTRVSGPLVSGGAVAEFIWAPDSSRIVYRATQNTVNVFELFTSLPDGTSNTRVSGALTTGQNVTQLWAGLPSNNWAPDSSRIAYIANQDTSTANELFTVVPDGTGNTKASGTLVAGGNVDQFWWPWNTGAMIAYSADQDTLHTVEIYTSTPLGAANTKVSAPLVAGGSVDAYAIGTGTQAFYWTSDGSRIIYFASGTSIGVDELYTALPNTAAGTVKVSGALLGGQVTDVTWSSDSSHVAYIAQQNTAGVYELYGSLTVGGGSVRISPPATTGGGVQLAPRGFSGDPRFVFRASTGSGSPIELYTAMPDGSATTKVSGTLVPGGNVQLFILPR